MDCPKCGAGNPAYAVYCGRCSALIKKPRYRGGWKRKGSGIVIEDDWARFKRLLKTAAVLILMAAGVVIVLWLCADYLMHNSSRYS